ncbi:MAG: hypothetical protein KGO82_14630 [Bacteroidota bacterium]|nr:hypothetical protein [Bacteroidota bacterium]
MPKWLRALIAAYGAKKLGGGCFSTIIIFIVIYYALGNCGGNRYNNAAPAPTGTTTQSPAPVKTAMLAQRQLHYL